MAKPDEEYMDEDERAERVRQWWKDNWLSIVGGAVLGLVGIFGWRAWQDHMADHQRAAANTYQAFLARADEMKPGQIAAHMAEFKAEFGDTPYAAMAALEAASQAYEAGKIDKAVGWYRYAAEHGQPEGVAIIAHMRLARVQMDQGQLAKALNTLNAVRDPGAFQSLIAELKGDIYVRQGNIARARQAYEKALANADPVAVRFLELKLSSLGSGIVTSEPSES